ncbi:MAG: S-layer homology domain-containing protein [Clostridiales bacterium]|nr:S-layer homology domain-containing protein [Clostridiales bacterium]
MLQRKSLALLIALALVWAAASPVALADKGKEKEKEKYGAFYQLTQFADLDEGDSWGLPFVAQLYVQGLVKGEGKGKFNPKASIKQGEVLALVLRAMYGGDEEVQKVAASQEGKASSDLKLTPPTRWVAPYLNLAEQLGLLEGFPFKADKAASREWATALLARGLWLAQGKTGSPTDVPRFQDADKIDSLYSPWIGWAQAQGWVSGYPDGSFKPKASISRLEFTKLVAAGLGMTLPDAKSVTQGVVKSFKAPDQLTVETKKDGDKTFTLAPYAVILQGKKQVTPDALVPGAKVKVHHDGELAFWVEVKAPKDQEEEEAEDQEEEEDQDHAVVLTGTVAALGDPSPLILKVVQENDKVKTEVLYIVILEEDTQYVGGTVEDLKLGGSLQVEGEATGLKVEAKTVTFVNP